MFWLIFANFDSEYVFNHVCTVKFRAFLKDGSYDVIFLHRTGSKVPEILLNATVASEQISCLTVTFTTLVDYMHLLRGAACALDVAGSRAMLYLAAAVSDFYLPQRLMSEHKIQSRSLPIGDNSSKMTDTAEAETADESPAQPAVTNEHPPGSLTLVLHPVPKVLRLLTHEWCSRAFTVTFKLETDASLLAPKARHALDQYKHSVVVANELHTRTSVVTLFYSDGKAVTFRKDGGLSLESQIVDNLSHHHGAHAAL